MTWIAEGPGLCPEPQVLMFDGSAMPPGCPIAFHECERATTQG